jgi:hypothetical protein
MIYPSDLDARARAMEQLRQQLNRENPHPSTAERLEALAPCLHLCFCFQHNAHQGLHDLERVEEDSKACRELLLRALPFLPDGPLWEEVHRRLAPTPEPNDAWEEMDRPK